MQQPALIIQETGQSIPLAEEVVTIGRKSGNTIVLEDDLKVSRHHCAISPENGAYIIRDVGSSNGTYLNKERLTTPQKLHDGDIIEIGDTIIAVHLPDADTRPSISPPPVLDADATMMSVPAPVTDPTVLKGSLSLTSDNPYVGPRTFTQAEGNRFFGREREARELLSLVISQRLVLFYAQSGAGKSSIINTRLIPQLRESGLPVLPIGRVSGELPEGIKDVENIFLFNLLLSLDESDGDPKRFTRMSISDFLLRLTSIDGQHYYYDDSVDIATSTEKEEEFESSPYVLIIDQFEEIITTHAARWQDREDFFRQLNQAMSDDPMLWVVLVMREDFIAALNPYTHLLPDNMRANFYMQRMNYEAALEAIKEPAGQYSRPFAPGVAENLVDNLRQVKVHGPQSADQTQTQPGQFIEPVQLQVVCYQLWEKLKNRPADTITQQDLDEQGNVDEALAQFYEQAVAQAVYRSGVSESELRNWFETQLITEAGTRGTVYRGTTQTGGIANKVVELLADKFIVRSEARTGGTWYELVHDRFVEPILQANQRWRLKQPLIQMAQAWDESGRNAGLLIAGQVLQEALETNWQALGPVVEEFLTASQAAQQDRERAKQAEELAQAQAIANERQQRLEEQARLNKKVTRRNMWLTIFAILMVLLVIIASGLAYFANLATVAARDRLAEAEQARQTAEAAEQIAEASLQEAILKSQQADAAVTEVIVQQETQTAFQEEVVMNNLATQEAQLTAQAQTATSEATRMPPTDTPTATPTEPPTPTGTITPSPPTHTPTPIPTPTRDLPATATANAIQVQKIVLQATQTAVARCPREVEGEFKKIWEIPEIKERLICPNQTLPSGGYFAEQPFQRGHMIWTQIFDLFIVSIGDGEKGLWASFTNEDVNSFGGNPLGTSCEVNVPEGLVQPIRGFGIIWCADPDIQKAIGFGTTPEFGVEGNAIQRFTGGIILRNHKNETYVFFNDDSTYIRMQ